MSERDYSNDYEDWLRDNPAEYQGRPENPDLYDNGPQYDQSPIGLPPLSPIGPLQTTPTTPNTKTDTTPYQETWTNEPRTQQYYTGTTGGGLRGYSPADIGHAPSFPDVGIVNYKPFQGPAPFKAPSAADMLKDPGFEFRQKMGEDSIKRNFAARGTLGTGGAQKGLIDYNQNFASLEYGNVYERAAGEYDRLYNNLMGEYKLGYQQALDTNDQQFRNAQASYAPQLREWEVGAAAKQRQAELEYLRDTDIWKTIYGAGAD